MLEFVAVAELASLPSVVTLKHAATSMFTKRAARAATNPALLGAADARWGLPGCDFVEPLAHCADAQRPACLTRHENLFSWLSPRIPQPRRNPVDRQVNPPLQPLHARIAFAAGAVAAREFHLQVVQRIQVREAVFDRPRQ
jgi:hypothetical protein